MTVKDNKGQALVAFILILPIILVVFAIVIDFGLLSIEKRKIANNVQDCILYGLDHMDDDNLEERLREYMYVNIEPKNIKDLNLEITGNSITITLIYKYKNLFGFIGERSNEISVSYIGTKEDNYIELKKR